MLIVESGAIIFDKFLSIIGLIREGRLRRDEKIDLALYALYAAINETISYTTNLKLGRRRDRKKEFAIAKLWHDASVPLRHIDQELARRCFIKGGYWLNPDTWTERMIKRKGIKLDQLLKSTRSVLLKS
jgi:hypothetical protein